MTSSGKPMKPLFDVQAEFNARHPSSPSVETAYNHTARLGIHLKSARPGTRTSSTGHGAASAAAAAARQARSAPVKRPTTTAGSGGGGHRSHTANKAAVSTWEDGTNQQATSGGGGGSGGKSVTFVDDLIQVVPLYDELNMHKSHTTTSFGGSSKICQLPLHPETDPASRRFTYSCKSRIMPLPVRDDVSPRPSSGMASGRVRTATPHKPPQPASSSLNSALTPRTLFLLQAPPPASAPLVAGGEQARRFHEEKVASQRLRLMRSLSELQSHRVDRRYYVCGQSMPVQPKYKVSEGAIEELLRARHEHQEHQRASEYEGSQGRAKRRATPTGPRKPVTVLRKPAAAPLTAQGILRNGGDTTLTQNGEVAGDEKLAGEREQSGGGVVGEKEAYQEGAGEKEESCEEEVEQSTGAVSVNMSIGGVPVPAPAVAHKDQSDYGSLDEGENPP